MDDILAGSEGEVKDSFISIDNKWFVLGAVAVVVWLAVRFGVPTDDVAVNPFDQYGLWLVTAAAVVYAANEALYKFSPKMIGNGISTTTRGEPWAQIGVFSIFSIGDIRAGAMEWPPPGQGGKSGCIVIPTWCWERRGKGVNIMCRTEKVMDPIRLPSNLRKELLQRGGRPPFHIGWVTEDVEREYPDMQAVLIQLQQESANANTFGDMLEKNMTQWSDVLDFVQRSAKSKFDAGPGLAGRAKRMITGNEEISIKD